MKKQFKPLLVFKSEDDERKFWAAHDSTDYIDWSKAERVIFPKRVSPYDGLKFPKQFFSF